MYVGTYCNGESPGYFDLIATPKFLSAQLKHKYINYLTSIPILRKPNKQNCLIG